LFEQQLVASREIGDVLSAVRRRGLIPSRSRVWLPGALRPSPIARGRACLSPSPPGADFGCNFVVVINLVLRVGLVSFASGDQGCLRGTRVFSADRALRFPILLRLASGKHSCRLSPSTRGSSKTETSSHPAVQQAVAGRRPHVIVT
jgi:hypothetical protein